MTDTEERIAMLESRVAILTECLVATLETPQATRLIEELDCTGWTPQECETQKVTGFMLNDRSLRKSLIR